MTNWIPVLEQSHSWLMRLYPEPYQEEFSEERQAVFELALRDACSQGGLSLFQFCWRELRDFPMGVIGEHLRQRRKRNMEKGTGGFFAFETGSWREALAAALPFLLLGAARVIVLISTSPVWLEGVIGLFFLIPTLILFISGIIKGMPRWFLPYGGVVLMYLSCILFAQINSLWFTKPSDSLILRAIDGVISPFLGMLGVVVLIVLLSAAIKSFRSFYQRLRCEWTLLSFSLYGAMLVVIQLFFDGYRGEEAFVIAAALLLAGGGWAYLKGKNQIQRALALFSGITLGMAVITFGVWLLGSSSNYLSYSHFNSQWTMLNMGMNWVWALIVVFAPAGLQLLPKLERKPT